MRLLQLACLKIIPATVSITADTGSELDRVCSNGKRMTNRQFFDDYVKPLAESHGIEALFVRARIKDGTEKMPVSEVIKASSLMGEQGKDFDTMIKGLSVPVFTNDRTKGRLRQACTDKWKIRAMHQEAKRRGIKLLRSAIGFHAGESHRIKARFIGDDGQWSIFKPQVVRNDGKLHDVKWLEHYYPCVDMKQNRADIRIELLKAGIPHLVTTECDFCPHQDYSRWMMHTPEVIEEACRIEAGWQGKLFFTSKRIPLKQALQEMKEEQTRKELQLGLPDFGCESGAYCGI